MKPHFKIFKVLFSVYLILTIFCIFLTAINLLIYIETKNYIFPITSYSSTSSKKDFAIVLGASVHGEKLSLALRYRVDAAITLYNKGLVQKILMTGDGMQRNYNETLAMKKFALGHGIPEEAIYIDAEGFNTYASIVRAKNIFHIKSAYIISQEFHIGRAVWIARHIGMTDALGVSVGGFKVLDYYTFREIFARSKDFCKIFLGYNT